MAMTITAEQAADAARGLTFEKVWAALMESRERQERASAEMDRQLKETFGKVEKSQTETNATLDRTAKQVGDLIGSVGRITEEMFAANLKAKFDGIYNFTKGGPQKFWKKNGSTAAQVDVFLENGEYAMAVEIKTTLKKSDVEDYLERIGQVRRCMDEGGSKRKLVGAVAGAAVQNEAFYYAQQQRLYVLTQSGESVVLAESPRGFKASEW
jgi:hypothetical protein